MAGIEGQVEQHAKKAAATASGVGGNTESRYTYRLFFLNFNRKGWTN